MQKWCLKNSYTPATACGKKHYCSQMVSCEEARFYFTQCKVKTLDKDGDGMPCETLCAAAHKTGKAGK